MAQLRFNKLGLTKKDIEVNQIHINDEAIIEIKKYLPINDKLELLTNTINTAIDSSGKFYNPAQVEVILSMAIIDYYTNITFTEKQKENYLANYDLLKSNGIIDKIKDVMGDEYHWLNSKLIECLYNIYQYQNSIMGMLENMQLNHDNLNLDAEEIRAKLADSENLDLLKEIAPLLNLA